MWLICGIDSLMAKLNNMDLITFGTELLIKYLVFLACYLLATYIIYNIRYTRGRRKLKMYYDRLKKVSRLYETEGDQNYAEDFDSF